jgi:hypothetical protein
MGVGMNFLRNLFGGGRATSTGADRGLYFYVRPKRCDQIVRVRIDPMNEVSESDEGGYFVRKIVSAPRCPFQAELTIQFDNRRQMTGAQIENGDRVSEADYDAWAATQVAGS